jgi:hypothetical protein
MAECEVLKTCPFFNDKMQGAGDATESYKARYCKGDFAQCARHTVYSKFGRAAVPSNLYPHELERAKLMLSIRSRP